MNEREKTVYVYAGWGPGDPALFGRLFLQRVRGKETASFSFSDGWLKKHGGSVFWGPSLSFYSGRQYATESAPLFGIFSDSAPDRWGRRLIRRREEMAAKKEGRRAERLEESDYLLGVYDETRMGGFRFSLQENGPFLSADRELAAPPWATLRTLESASLALEGADGAEAEKWLRQLIAPGSSLGGARPKASVEAPDGSLWIAKFPSRHDESDSGAWEMTVRDLADECGLRVPEARLERFSASGSTYLCARFDRDGKERTQFVSALSLLGKKDGDEASFLDIASFIRSYGQSPARDLAELWQRIVFCIAVSDTDCHLRNHGFLLRDGGWQLAPMYDVNPDRYGGRLALAIDGTDGTPDFDLALSVAKYFGLSETRASHMMREIRKTVSARWRDTAGRYGISRGEAERMAPAFALA